MHSNIVIIEKTIKLCKCNKCGYEWIPTKKYQENPELIKTCMNPKHCRTKAWNTDNTE